MYMYIKLPHYTLYIYYNFICQLYFNKDKKENRKKIVLNKIILKKNILTMGILQIKFVETMSEEHF